MLKKLAAEAFPPGTDWNVIDKLLLYRFMEGLDGRLRQQIKLTMPGTLDQALASAEILNGGSQYDHQNIEAVTRQAPPQLTRREAKVPIYDGKLPTVRNLKPRDPKNPAENAEPSRRPRPERPADSAPAPKPESPQAPPPGSTRCFICNQVGHWRSECPHRQSNQTQRNPAVSKNLPRPRYNDTSQPQRK